jgi:glucose-1-phosphate thymidylyltransferase
MYLGDNLLQGGISELVAAFREHSPDALILLTPVPDPQNYGVAELAPADGARGGRPGRAPDREAGRARDRSGAGRRVHVHRQIHDAARAIEPSARGELEITDAIQHLLDGGMRVEPHIVRGWWKDTGRLEDMLEANRLILDNLPGAHRRRADRLAGRRARGDRGRAPAWSARPCAARDHRRGRTADDCYIGPYTAIGENC